MATTTTLTDEVRRVLNRLATVASDCVYDLDHAEGAVPTEDLRWYLKEVRLVLDTLPVLETLVSRNVDEDTFRAAAALFSAQTGATLA